jgi:hypothetical protein
MNKMKTFVFTKTNGIPDFLQKECIIDSFEGSLYQKYYETDFDEEFKTKFQEYFSDCIGNKIEISFGWMNFTKYTGVNNTFKWHNENGVNGEIISDYEYSCVFWLLGETNKGGDFKYIDGEGNINVVKLDPPGFMIINKDTLHSVENYLGKTHRVSFNFNFRLTG